MGIGEFRRTLSERVEAAAFGQEATVIRHDKRGTPRAALIPFEVGAEPIPISVEDGEVRSYAVSREWFERASAALDASG